MVVVAWEKKLKEERIKWMLFVIFANGIEIWLTTYYRSKRYQSCNLGTILLAYPRYILCLYGRSSLSFNLLSTTTVSCAADEAFLELEGILTYIHKYICWHFLDGGCVDVLMCVCVCAQGNVIGRAVIEFCDSGPPVSLCLFWQTLPSHKCLLPFAIMNCICELLG
jgi:hypothetical protein